MKNLYTLLLMLCSVVVSAQTVIYLNSTTGDNSFNGLSSTVNGTQGPKRTFGGDTGALALAAEGDIISVEAGTYSENVVIDHNISFVKTGSGQVAVTSMAFVNSARLIPSLPTDVAFNIPLVTINDGSSVIDGATLVGTNGTLVLNAGNYNESLFLSKSFNLLAIGNPSIQDVILAGNGITVVLEGSLAVSNSLQFNRPEGGKFEISSGQLRVLPGALMTAGTGMSYAVTTGGGQLVADVQSSGTVLPIGIASAYTPITISGVTSGTDEAVSVSVRGAGNVASFNPDLPLQVNSHIRLEWSIQSNIEGNATIRFDYNGTFEPSDWNEVQNRVVARALSQTYESAAASSVIGESFASAEFSVVKGVFAIYSDFPNAIPMAEQGMQFSAFPNPFHDAVSLQLNGRVSEHVSINVTDMAGRLLSSEQVVLSSPSIIHALNTHQLEASGIYFVSIASESGISTLRISKN